MVRGGFELIAGVVNDAVFGPVVVVGAGGIYTEILRDSACRLAPFDEDTAREMLDELQCRRILDGARGGAPLDVDAVAKALAALSQFAWESRELVQEVDVNPLFVLPTGRRRRRCADRPAQVAADAARRTEASADQRERHGNDAATTWLVERRRRASLAHAEPRRTRRTR